MISGSRRAALAALFVIGGVLAACSSGGAKPTSTPAATSTVAATRTPATTASAATAAATQAAAGPAEGVGANLAEFSISGTSSVRAGRVTFEVSNSGMAPHNLHVVKSDAALNALSQKDGQVDLSKLQVVVKTADILVGGDDVKADATLAAGRYLMFCNVVGHYQLGMVKELIVK